MIALSADKIDFQCFNWGIVSCWYEVGWWCLLFLGFYTIKTLFLGLQVMTLMYPNKPWELNWSNKCLSKSDLTNLSFSFDSRSFGELVLTVRSSKLTYFVWIWGNLSCQNLSSFLSTHEMTKIPLALPLSSFILLTCRLWWNCPHLSILIY